MKTHNLQIICLAILLWGLSNHMQAQETAMNYKDLQAYLPTSINGYESGDIDGQSMNMSGMSFSTAEIEFKNSDGKYIRITLMDYSAAMGLYQAATAMWALGMSFEDDESIAKSVQWEEKIVGWEEYRKIDKEAKLALGIGNRFFLSIEASEQSNMDLVKSIAKKMDLTGLSNK
ncbi:MAG: hypothetical protein R2764_18370 [Bacteroidales bacterium]